MIDIKLLRENPEMVKENMKKKFQDHKLGLVDEVLELDTKNREVKLKGDELRNKRKTLSQQIGLFMKNGEKEKAEETKLQVNEINNQLEENEKLEAHYAEEIKNRMMKIPNIIDPSVPIGKDDSQNVEVQRFGEPKIPDYEIPYHADIIDHLNGMDKDSAGRTSGVGFYYLLGNIARLHEAMLAYARDYMIDHGFTYAIPPFMIRSDVVTGVMSFEEMDAMMYKIE
ncbi:MAG: serine--tRNA ligase, partial [Clostridia bacterium]